MTYKANNLEEKHKSLRFIHFILLYEVIEWFELKEPLKIILFHAVGMDSFR